MRKFIASFVLLVALSSFRSIPSLAQNVIPTSGTLPGTLPAVDTAYLPFMALTDNTAPMVVGPIAERYSLLNPGEWLQVICVDGSARTVNVGSGLLVTCEAR